MSKIKPINLESDTFAQMKQDMTQYLNLLLRLMQRYGEEKATLTLKMTVTLEEQELDDGCKGLIPTFEHRVTTSVQRKDETKGKLPGEYVLDADGKGGFNLRPMSDQLDMFEDQEEGPVE